MIREKWLYLNVFGQIEPYGFEYHFFINEMVALIIPEISDS